MSWAVEEVKPGTFEDPRLDRRLARTVKELSDRPNCSPTESFKTKAGLMGAYRLWDNPRASPKQILSGHVEQTVQRAKAYSVVLAIQDTTSWDATSRRGVQGLGYLGSEIGRGLWVHSVFAVAPTGTPLGTLRQIVWSRPPEEFGKRHQRLKRPLEDKESRRWLHGLRAASTALTDHNHVVVIGDRESDLFPLFSAPRSANTDLLVRVTREGRRVDHEAKYLGKALEQSPVKGVVEISLPRTGNHASRTAQVTVRWISLKVHSPVHSRQSPSVQLQFILIEEGNAPKGVKPIRWVLVTTMPVESLQSAMQYVQWYAYRWRIEQFHQVWKDGCRIEELQLEEADNIRRAIATYAIVAWRLLWLTLQARETPDVPCTVIFEEHEWKVLHARIHKNKRIPATPPTLREAVRMTARLGGFLARKGDGEPGPKTLWRGLRCLHDLTLGWRLAQKNFNDSG